MESNKEKSWRLGNVIKNVIEMDVTIHQHNTKIVTAKLNMFNYI